MGEITDVLKLATALKECSQTPRLDARFFYEHYSNHPTQAQISEFIQRRKAGEPVAKILGKRGFWKRDFRVSSDVLDPRPDTETLIETVLRFYPEQTEPYRILDIGTGSGCILLSLLGEYPNACGIGVDKSLSALKIAQENNGENTAHRVEFCQADFTDDDFGNRLGAFDIIVSNPPYIPTNDIDTLEKSVKCYDPLIALDGGYDGLDAYRHIAQRVSALKKEGGLIFLEIGQGQENDVVQIMKRHQLTCREQVKDLGGIIRVLVFG